MIARMSMNVRRSISVHRKRNVKIPLVVILVTAALDMLVSCFLLGFLSSILQLFSFTKIVKYLLPWFFLARKIFFSIFFRQISSSSREICTQFVHNLYALLKIFAPEMPKLKLTKSRRNAPLLTP